MSFPTPDMVKNILSVLIRLDKEAHEPNISPEEYARRGVGIGHLLRKVEEDFNTGVMLKIFVDANKEAGHTIGPLDTLMLKKLMELGCKVTNIKSCMEVGKEELNKCFE